MNQIRDLFQETFDRISTAQAAFQPALFNKEVGRITSISSGIVKAIGLPHAGFSELIHFPRNVYGFVFSLEKEEVGIVLLDDPGSIKVDDEIERTGRVVDVPVGDELIGRVIDPLGRPLDDKGPLKLRTRLPIERPAPPIMHRSPVEVPLQTGLKVLDALVPIGRGQRELILGDRKTGKSSLAIDTILNQQGQNVLCIYCTIGQRASFIAKTIRDLEMRGALAYTIFVVTEGNDSPGLSFIAPYSATTIGEYFMEQGRDVLIVYDDLTQHATTYRELSLLLKRPPGRSAFPGDIFYIHSRLLERATHLKPELGGGSLTALPIVETQAENISAYIPTNLISITDGQIYTSPTLFELGVLPAVDVTKSVSRVGGKAQKPAYMSIAGSLKLTYSQFEELEEFVRFGAHLDEHAQQVIEHGRRIRACLTQKERHPVSVLKQIMLFLALVNGLFDSIPLEKMEAAEESLSHAEMNLPLSLKESFQMTGQLQPDDKNRLLSIMKEALTTL